MRRVQRAGGPIASRLTRSPGRSACRSAPGIEALERRQVLSAVPVAHDDVFHVRADQPFVVDAPITAGTTGANFAGLQAVTSFSVASGIEQVEYSKQYDVLCVRVGNSKVRILDGATGAEISSRDATESFTDFDLSPDGRWLFVADYGGEAMGYGTPTRPHLVHRLDLSTRTWETKQAPQIAWKIEAVSGTRVLLQEHDQWVDMTLNDFGELPSDPMKELARAGSDYYGDSEYDFRTGRVYHGSTGSSSQAIQVLRVNGDALTSAGGTGVYGTAQGGGPTSVLSADGRYFFYGRLQFDAVSLTKLRTTTETIYASAGNVSLGSGSFYNALTDRRLGSLPFPSTVYAASDDGNDVWAYDAGRTMLHHYRTPGAIPGVLANDSDADGAPLTTVLVSGPQHGTLTLQPDGSFTYRSQNGFDGIDSFTYQAVSGDGTSAPATVTLDVHPANVPIGDYATAEDHVLTVEAARGLLQGKTPAGGGSLEVSLETKPFSGTLTVTPEGAFTYTPAPDFFGVDRFTFRVRDGQTLSEPEMVTIAVTPVPDSPAAASDSYVCETGVPLIVDAPITAGTTGANFAGLQAVTSFSVASGIEQVEYSKQYDVLCVRVGNSKVRILDGATGAEISSRDATESFTDFDLSPDGRWLFVADYGGEAMGYGTPTRPHLVHRLDLSTRTWETKQAPQIAWKIEAVSGTRVLLQEHDQWVDMTLNDFGELPSDPMKELARAGSDYYGDSEYDFRTGRVYHGSTGSSSQAIQVLRVNGDALTSAGGTGVYGTAQGGGPTSVLSADGRYFFYGRLQFDAVSLTKLRTTTETIYASAGNVSLGSGSFYNALTDRRLGSLPFPSTVYAASDDGNDVWAYDAGRTMLHHYRTPGAIPGVLANDSDADGAPLTTVLVSGPQNGTLTLQPDGSFRYAAHAGFLGTDSFQYTANDGMADSDVATVTIRVIAGDHIGHAPAGTDGTLPVPTGTPHTFGVADFGFTDPDDDPADRFTGVRITVLPDRGSLALAGMPVVAGQFVAVEDIAAGNLTFAPAPGAGVPRAALDFQVEDSGSTARGGVNLDPVPKTLWFDVIPKALNDRYSLDENDSLGVSTAAGVLANDTDADGDSLAALLVSGPQHGTVALAPDGSFRYTPEANYFGLDSFTYKASDGLAESTVATVVVRVNPVVYAPVTSAPGGLLLRYRGDNLQLVNQQDNNLLFDQAADWVRKLTVFGLDNTADALSVDLGYVAPRSKLGAIVFVGGTKSPEDGPKDSLSIRGVSGTDVFSVEAGTIRANGLAIGFSGVEEVILDGAAGNDAYIVSALVATTTIEDADGTDDLDFSAAASGVTIDLGMSSGLAQKIFVSSSATLALKGTFENVVGSSSADWIRGNSTANRLRGRGGSDELFGGGGDDTLHGGGGDDTLRGGGGNDTLYGGLGNNVLLGGAGDDFLDVSVAAAVGSDTRNLLIGGVGSDTLQGGSGQEILIGGTTKYDAKAAAFAAIMKEWTATSSFAQRALNLETGITAATLGLIRLVRKTAVRSGTVWDDGAPDALFGGPGKDWFLDSPNDVTRDRGPRDR